MKAALTAVALVAAVPVLLRWLRVAQREHYLAGSASRFAVRWARALPVNGVLLAAAVIAAALAIPYPAAALAGAGFAAAWPVGLRVKGRTSPLRWTARLRRLAGGTALLYGGLVAAGFLTGAPQVVALAATLAVPVLVDVALAFLAPVEHRLGARWVDAARRRLDDVQPLVVAVTGSYGKTTTKEHIRHLLAATHVVVASPASFNNRMGLARTVNEHMAPGTQVLVAEMGAYRRGEIAAMCEWVRPSIGVITAIGPVHLERFGTLDDVAAAKAEIVAGAETAVLNVDHQALAALADRLAGDLTVLRCSTQDPAADVCVEASGAVHVRGETVANLTLDGAHPANVACAVAVAVACDVPRHVLKERLGALPTPDHRATVVTGAAGVVLIDDTYNSNPAGARAALRLAAAAGGPRAHRVVVTPGMVELGPRQHQENVDFAREAAAVASDLVIVGRTNRRALLAGAGDATSVTVVADRERAVEWVKAAIGAGDVVLYENDLPDHYP